MLFQKSSFTPIGIGPSILQQIFLDEHGLVGVLNQTISILVHIPIGNFLERIGVNAVNILHKVVFEKADGNSDKLLVDHEANLLSKH